MDEQPQKPALPVGKSIFKRWLHFAFALRGKWFWLVIILVLGMAVFLFANRKSGRSEEKKLYGNAGSGQEQGEIKEE